MSDIPFGSVVNIRAEVMRLVGTPLGDGRFRYQHAVGGHWGRYEKREFDPNVEWPGGAIGGNWETPVGVFPISPSPNGAPVARVRRFEFVTPETGLVIGWTRRIEGTIAAVSGKNELLPPLRTIPLVEIALRTDGRARLILAHRNDLHVVAGVR